MELKDKIFTRHVGFTPRRDDGEGTGTDGLTLVGLATPFNSPTRIDNIFEGTFDEQFAEGAFKRTLGIRTPVMQFDHGTHPLMGSIPIGTFSKLEESKRGLEVEGRVFDNWMTEPLRHAIAGRAVTGMSIRFRVRAFEEEDRGEDEVPLVTIREAELFEAGPVVFPAYENTEVDLRNLDLESALRSEEGRHLLAMALLSGDFARGENNNEPTTGPAGSPGESDSASSHSGMTATQRSRKIRLHQHIGV